MSSSTRHTFFVTCAPGLEPLLHREIQDLRLRRSERQVGGVRFEGTLADAWRANLQLRTAVRVLCRLSRFYARDADALYTGISQVAWTKLLPPGGTLCVDAQTKDSELSHSRFIEQRTKDAVVDQVRALTDTRPDVDRDAPNLRIHVHIYRDRVTLSLDTSGDSLHKRGWRRAQGRAPLAETLAAALVLQSGWDRRAPLLDPFAGSGTVLIEAGLLACNVAPGLFRERFGFESLLDHDNDSYLALKTNLAAQRKAPRKLSILGTDIDPARVEEATTNAAAAGLDDLVSFEVADARHFAPRPGWNAWIVTNPPYGQRLASTKELLPLYEGFGRILRNRCNGYTLALLTSNPDLTRALALDGLTTTDVLNGGLECTLLSGRLESASRAGKGT